MTEGVPFGTAPSHADVARAVEDCTRIEVRRHDQRAAILYPPRFRDLVDSLQLSAEPRARRAAAHTELWLERSGHPTGKLLIHDDLTVRWVSWRDRASLQAPQQLRDWLAELGIDAPAPPSPLDDAPAELRAHLASLTKPEAHIGDDIAAFDALASAGGPTEAVWTLCRWLGTTADPTIPQRLLEAHGIRRVVDLAAQDTPPNARRGLAKFLVAAIDTRGWGLTERLAEPLRIALRDEAPDLGPALFGETQLAPDGTQLVSCAQHGRFRRLCDDGTHLFAIDGTALVRLDDVQPTELFRAFDPASPVAVLGASVWVQHHSGGALSIPTSGGDARSRFGPWFGGPARRLRTATERFARARDEALAATVPLDVALLTVDPEPDACVAYAAFGGSRLPAPLEATTFFAADLDRHVLHAAAAATAVEGQIVWLGSGRDDRALVIARRSAALSVAEIDRDGAMTTLLDTSCAWHPRHARWLGERLHLVLAAPLGDVVVVV